jgi:hypothetical protein
MREIITKLAQAGNKISTKSVNDIKNYLSDLGKVYHKSIPLTDILNKFKEHGIEVENNFILTGREGRTSLELTYNGKLLKPHLQLVWHKMDSGNWEVTAYIA